MAVTKVEKMIRHTRTRSGILVPKIEDFMRKPVEIESAEDVEFLTALFDKMRAREEARSSTDAVFSPSALATCLRRVYLLKHSARLGIPRHRLPRIEPSFYFLNGNFLHVKWQFVLFKMMQAGVPGIEPLEIDDVAPYWCEVRILSKRKDHGGTLDVALRISGEPMFIDFKGLNVRTFGEIQRGYMPRDYEIQLADYMTLYNSQKPKPPERVERSLLIAENKGGPVNKHPVALHESEILLEDHKPEVRRRLGVLRDHEEEDSIPQPECVSTRGFQFGSCEFAKFCKAEVKEIEQRRRDAESRDSAEPSVATPRRRRNRSSR